MSQSHNFRSALGGFNREDVVRYIEYINSKNTSAVNQLKSENQSLKDELNALRANQSAPVEPAEDLRPELDAALAKIAELEAQLAEAEESARTAKAQLEEQKAENLRLQVLLDAALARQNEAHNTAELDTYRRAERVERDARNRAREVSDKANAALSDATNKVDETAIQISELTEAAMQKLRQLQLAISGSKQILRDTATVLYSIRPEDEE